jgi:acetate---CoA ligase (ADP-forming)
VRITAAPPAPFDAPSDSPLILRDGSVATVRAAGPLDQNAVREFFHALTPESRYRRFFSPSDPPADVISRLCGLTDGGQGVTLLAVRSLPGEERLIGTASYIRIDDAVAEVAFAVDDNFGHLGIATGLLERLAALGSDAGFTRFRATTLAENTAMLQVFRDSGFMIKSKLDGSCVEVELALTPSARSVAAIEQREHLATAASIRPLLHPESVTVVGVSRDSRGLGRRIFESLVTSGYQGRLYAVNAHADEIAGVKVFRSVRDLPHGIDLAIVAVPQNAVLEVIDDCAAAAVKSTVVISAGFAEVGPEGWEQQQRLLDKVRGYGMRMIGPNCMGVLNTPLKLNASFSPIVPPPGRIALSSQSGALGLAILSLARERQIGLSTFVSVGNKADVSGNDLLQYWEDDPATRVILLYLESFGNPRRFVRLARRIGQKKPIVALKAGRTRAGRRAAGSHTAALAASEVAVDALFRQSGVIRADTIDEMFDIGACLDSQPLPAGRRVAILTNAGGPGILAVDACDAAGLAVPEFAETTRQRLAEFLPPVATLTNPVDMVASAGPEEYRHAIAATLDAEEVDALIVIYAPIDLARSGATLDAIREGIAAARQGNGKNKPVLACLIAEPGHPAPLEASGERIPAYAFPENAVRALGKIATYATWRTQPPGLFWSFDDIRADEAKTLCQEILEARGDTWLTSDEWRRVASAFGLPIVRGLLAHNAEESRALAATLGFPVAGKASSREIIHKSDIDGVRLNLASADAAAAAFEEIFSSAREHGVAEQLDGVLIQPMVVGGTEMIVGLVEDPLFGPLVGVGMGGIFVEALGTVRFRIAPLTDRDTDELLAEIRSTTLLDGYRGRPPADVDALAEVLLRVSRLAEEIPDIVELDLNPVMVLPAGQGCRIVDARVRIGRRPSTNAQARTA